MIFREVKAVATRARTAWLPGARLGKQRAHTRASDARAAQQACAGGADYSDVCTAGAPVVDVNLQAEEV